MSSEAARQQFKRWIEGRARALRAKAEIDAFARLDPLVLAERMGIAVQSVHAFDFLPESILDAVLGPHGSAWDAGTLCIPGGPTLVVFNPNRDVRRRNATLMEELAHVHLGHKPSALTTVGTVVLRTCNASVETQAYSVGAAALLPEYLLKGARTRGYSREQVADQHQVSLQLVEYREKVTGVRLRFSVETAA